MADHTSFHLRRIAAALLLGSAVLIGAPANAQLGGQAGPLPSRTAYDVAVKCFVANVVASGQRKRAGDTAKADYYKQKSSDAYEAAKVLGKALAFTPAQIEQDFTKALDTDMPRMMRDDAYFLNVVKLCKSMQFM